MREPFIESLLYCFVLFLFFEPNFFWYEELFLLNSQLLDIAAKVFKI